MENKSLKKLRRMGHGDVADQIEKGLQEFDDFMAEANRFKYGYTLKLVSDPLDPNCDVIEMVAVPLPPPEL